MYKAQAMQNNCRLLYDLDQHQKGKKVFITEQAIEKAKLVIPSGYTMEEAEKIQEMNKSILRYSMDCNYSNEVAMILDGKGIVTGPVFGDQHSVNIEGDSDMYHLLRTSPMRSLVISHNHPGLSYFSYDDLGIFVQYPSIKIMMVVTNRGRVFCLLKKETWNDVEALNLYKQAGHMRWKSEPDAIASFLKNTYNAIERSR